jgi:hypothetical protein
MMSLTSHWQIEIDLSSYLRRDIAMRNPVVYIYISLIRIMLKI